jgi:hypothetical protein
MKSFPFLIMAAVLLAAATVLIGPRDLPAAVALTFTASECTLFCSEGGCPTGQHDAWEPCLTPADASGTDHGGGCDGAPVCLTGTCGQMHPPCGGLTAVDIEGLRLAVASGDEESIAALALTAPESVLLNVSRSAVQLKNCNDLVIAHFPVSRRLIVAVAGRLTPVRVDVAE